MSNVRWCRNEFLWLQKALDVIGFGSLSSKKETGIILLLVNYQEIKGVERHSRQVKKCTIVGTFRNHESSPRLFDAPSSEPQMCCSRI